MMTLRDRLRSGDIWVEGSRSFRAFDDFVLPPEIFAARQCEDELGLAVSGRLITCGKRRSRAFRPDAGDAYSATIDGFTTWAPGVAQD
jgi:hypothetical protein